MAKDKVTRVSDYFKAYKRIYSRVIRTAKRFWKDERINQARNKSKEMWNIIREDLGKSSNHNKRPITLMKDGVLISAPTQVAQILNEHFTTLPNVHSNPNIQLPTPNPASFFLLPTDEVEVVDIIKSLKRSNSCGNDLISTNFLKTYSSYFAPILTELINQSFLSGTFPSVLKIAKVTPIPKPGDPQNQSNYRPINLLSSFSKVIEKIVYRRLYSFLAKHKCLSKHQHGFRSKRSTQSALFHFLEKVYSDLDQGSKLAAVFFDITRAFESVSLDILIAKLEAYGIRGTALEWFKTYLLNRSQTVILRVGSQEY